MTSLEAEGPSRPKDAIDDHDLIAAARAGSSRAVEALIDRYRWFAHYKTRHYFIPGGDRDDLLQEAMVGLFHAIRDFDASRGQSLMVFADVCINGQILTAIKKANRKTHKLFEKALRLDAPSFLGASDEHSLIEDLENDPTDDPVRIVEAADEIERAKHYLMQALTRMEADVLTLYSQGRSYEEMAEALRSTTKGVDNALQRVRRKVKDFLLDQELSE